MNTQTVEFKIGLGINSYCRMHPEQPINVTFNQREGGLVDAIIHPCCLCLEESEAFGRANQRIDDERNKDELPDM